MIRRGHGCEQENWGADLQMLYGRISQHAPRAARRTKPRAPYTFLIKSCGAELSRAHRCSARPHRASTTTTRPSTHVHPRHTSRHSTPADPTHAYTRVHSRARRRREPQKHTGCPKGSNASRGKGKKRQRGTKGGHQGRGQKKTMGPSRGKKKQSGSGGNHQGRTDHIEQLECPLSATPTRRPVARGARPYDVE